MTKKSILIIGFALFAITAFLQAATASAEDYNYIKAEDLQKRIEANSPMIIIDIQPAKEFAEGHIKGAIETNAFPAKTDEEKARLAEQLPKIKASSEDVVIVCPRGGGGAKNTFNYYKENGVDVKRLLILENGMAKWPFDREKK